MRLAMCGSWRGKPGSRSPGTSSGPLSSRRAGRGFARSERHYRCGGARADGKSVVKGKSVFERVEIGVSRIILKKKIRQHNNKPSKYSKYKKIHLNNSNN